MFRLSVVSRHIFSMDISDNDILRKCKSHYVEPKNICMSVCLDLTDPTNEYKF